MRFPDHPDSHSAESRQQESTTSPPEPAPEMQTQAGGHTDDWQLDPRMLPRRIDLELSEPLQRLLRQRSERSGRSISELALEIINLQLGRTADG